MLDVLCHAVKLGSLFAGIGGFDLGFAAAGMTPTWHAEMEFDTDAESETYGQALPRQANAELLAARFGVHNYGDVRSVDGRVPRVDVLCGGFPCQDLSVAGNRAGLAGERSGLFFEFMRIVDAVTPRWVVIENVPGLLSSNEGRDMGTVVGVLADLGYGWAYRVLDAQYFGVAQRRRRVFIVGCLGDGASAASVLFERQSCDRDLAPRRETGTRVAALTAGGVGTCGPDDNQAQAGHLIPEISGAVTAPANGPRYNSDETLLPVTFDWQAGSSGDTSWRGKARSWIVDPPGRTRSLVANRTLAVAFHQTQEPITEEEMSPALGATSIGMGVMTVGLGSDPISADDLAQPITGRNGDPGVVAYATKLHNTESNQAGKFYENYAPSLQADSPPPAVAYRKAQKAHDPDDCERWEQDDLATTLDAGGQGPRTAQAVVSSQDMAVRRLTPVECERLQGFPDGWTGGFPDSTRYRMLGNAVCVPNAWWIGRRIVRVDAALGE